MIFKNLKEQLFFNKEEIIINKKTIIRGMEVNLLSFTKDEDKNTLWMLYKNESIQDDISYEGYNLTNREELINNITSNNISISEMIIQGQTVTFESSCSGSIEDINEYENMMIRHFIEEGLISDEWDYVDTRNIIVARYEQKEDEYFPQINYNEDINIILKVDKEFKEVLVQHPFNVKIGKLDKDTKIYYFDEYTKEDKFFYLNEIRKYDIWEDISENLDKTIKHLEESQREEIKKDYINGVESICPKGMYLAIISYETEDDMQLRFFTKEYLELKPKYDTYSSAVYFTFAFDDEESINGYKNRIEHLKPIEKNFDDELEIELFSKYIEIPEEIILL